MSLLSSLIELEWYLQIPFLFFIAGIAIEFIGLYSTFLFRFQKHPTLDTAKPLPGVTILKPCRENDDNEEENFDAFFNQNYPGPVEVLFIVAAENHPIVPVVRDYLKRYPAADARLVFSQSQAACSPKINSLYDGHIQSKHEIVIWSDSDVMVAPSYVTEMVASLQEPGVSLVTTPQYDARVNTFGSAFKVLANNCDVATFVMAYALFFKKKRIAWGHSAGFWKSDFDTLPVDAWTFLNKFLADDLGLPRLFADHGKQVVFRNIYCPVECSDKTLEQMVEQKKRWVMCQRLFLGNRYLYLAGALFYPQIAAVFLLIFSGFSSWAWAAFFGAAILRIVISGIFEMLFLNSLKMSLRYFWTILLWDLAQIYFFGYGFSCNTITFRGISYRILPNYSLSPVVG